LNGNALAESRQKREDRVAVPLGPTAEDGDYLADDGTKVRVIDGKPYLLVQYFIPDTPPILPDSSGIAGRGAAEPLPSPQIAVPQNIVPIQDYRTATQVTQILAGVPIPSYSAILRERQAGSLNFGQGLVTVTAPATVVTVLPESSEGSRLAATGNGVETVPSLKYSDYSSIGTQTAALSSATGNTYVDNDEMRSSIWSFLAAQNNDLLLYP